MITCSENTKIGSGRFLNVPKFQNVPENFQISRAYSIIIIFSHPIVKKISHSFFPHPPTFALSGCISVYCVFKLFLSL